MSQSSDLEEGEHPVSQDELSPLKKLKDNKLSPLKKVEDNNHDNDHKILTQVKDQLIRNCPRDDKVTVTDAKDVKLKEVLDQPDSKICPMKMVPLEEQFLLICEKESNDLKSQESTHDSIDDCMRIDEENSTDVDQALSVAALKSVKSLTCPICDEMFHQPRMLPCFHTFCSSCIQKQISADQFVKCPICLRMIKLVNPTAEEFPANSVLEKCVRLAETDDCDGLEDKTCSTCGEKALFWCVECQTTLCDKCRQVHANIKAVSHHRMLSSDEVSGNLGGAFRKTENCSAHGNALVVFCESCSEFICRDCTLIVHRSHKYSFAKDFLKEKQNNLQIELDRAEAKLVPLRKLLHSVEGDTKEIEHDTLVKEEIKKATELLVSQIREKEKMLLGEITNKAQSRSEALRNKYKEIKYAIESSQSSLDFMGSLIIQAGVQDIGRLEEVTRSRVAEITSYRPEVQLCRRIPRFKPANIPQISIGRIYGCFDYGAIGQYPHLIGVEGKEDGQLTFPTGMAFHPDGSILVVDRSNRMQIFNRTGVFIREITMTMSNTDPVGKLKNPNSVAVDKEGYIYVADSSKHRVAVFDQVGRFSHEIGAKSKSASCSPSSPQLLTSQSPPMDPDSRYRDYYHRPRPREHSSPYHRTRVPSSDKRRDYLPRDVREYKKQRSTSSVHAELNGPRGVEISKGGLVVVADTTNHCVKVFTKDGSYLLTIGSEGTAPGQLCTPSGVALDSLDNVYVTDSASHRVTCYKVTGEYVIHFGKRGSGPGEFLFPSDIAVDICDHVYVADCDNNRIQVFDSKGEFVRVISVDRAGTTLKKPLSVAVDGDGNVGICDTGHHRLWVL